MTERKAFKRRVRAQMERTGQGYAQAAAQLEAGNPARRADTHPASAVVVALLRASGLTLDPVTAFGIGGGIGFMYALFRYRDTAHPLLTLVCQHHPDAWAPAILERLEVEHTAASGKRELARVLDADRPVILPVARGAIPWLAPDPLTAGEEHVVLALPQGEGARIFDGTGAHARLTRTALVEGYASTRRKHPVVTVADGATLPEDLGAAVAAGLRATVSGMTGPVLGNAFDVNFGLSGLRRWAERVAAPGPDGWGEAFAQSDVWRTRLTECITTEHTAPVAGRPLFARLLRQAGHPDAAEHFDRSARHWRTIAADAERGTLGLDDLAPLVGAIADDEAAGITALSAALDGAGASAASAEPGA
ncbi:hypothetical protein Xcel_1085 [Xylanimonas cellulosilytica DSM 15894]|uniref:Butirosin biosynthesis protein H N-terminal domain-containing protein n=1 Tax=Xylanimonas cellulosilytica (strain DSM 15894 / JCM 12276 / CECT 5975 / KCTC 9989 / LMG 20990 / NBRC 107835 / XIL07) TaxID=446471 RepID=D1BZG2_XYLCX|nr:BtrH N-terminal domain-containing protein [Xylanimonas cellulosilytica]ACZ30116.1 hypothetical protein Xcel_1085 [Xylanimonas cellulosilytica DSM 15894]